MSNVVSQKFCRQKQPWSRGETWELAPGNYDSPGVNSLALLIDSCFTSLSLSFLNKMANIFFPLGVCVRT